MILVLQARVRVLYIGYIDHCLYCLALKQSKFNAEAANNGSTVDSTLMYCEKW